MEKISDKPIKVILYSHSPYALGGGALVDDPDDVLVIGQPTRKSGRRTGSLSCER